MWITTAGERAALADALIATHGVERRETLCIDGPIRYGAPGMCEGVRRLLAGLRPEARPVTFTERVRSIQEVLDGLAPRTDEPAAAALLTSTPSPAPVRKRGARRR